MICDQGFLLQILIFLYLSFEIESAGKPIGLCGEKRDSDEVGDFLLTGCFLGVYIYIELSQYI